MSLILSPDRWTLMRFRKKWYQFWIPKYLCVKYRYYDLIEMAFIDIKVEK